LQQQNISALIWDFFGQCRADTSALTFPAWAQANICIKGTPFSFKGHAYLEQIYRDTSPEIVLQKAVQMGASIYGVTRAMHLAATYGEAATYFMPVKQLAFAFSGARVRDEIIMTSPSIKALMSQASIDCVSARRIGRGVVNFRGMQTAVDTQSDPADFVIIDEYDLIKDPRRINEAIDRLSHSERKWKLFIGIPSIDDWGIDARFRKSTQQHWHLICPGCNHEQDMTAAYPDCLQMREGQILRVCIKCSRELNCQQGIWVPHGTGDVQGYHLSQLFSEYADLQELWEKRDSGLMDENFMRQKLGKPFVAAENRLSLTELNACRREYTFNLQAGTIMGCDTGKNWHYIVCQKDGELYKTVSMGVCEDGNALAQVMNTYNVNKAVIDPGGNITAVKAFVNAHEGRALCCYYHANDKQHIDYDDRKMQVNAHRTATLDESNNLIRGQKLHLPMQGSAELDEFKRHCLSLVRTREEDPDTGKMRFTWVRSGADHYRHAWNYCYIAGQCESEPAIRIL